MSIKMIQTLRKLVEAARDNLKPKSNAKPAFSEFEKVNGSEKRTIK